MKKVLLLLLILLFGHIGFAQTVICWRNEMVKYNPSSGQYEAFVKDDKPSEAFFNDQYIRVGDLRLTKKKIISKTKSKEGIVTIYDVVDEKSDLYVATIVEDSNGIFRMLLTIGSNAEIGIVYYFKNR